MKFSGNNDIDPIDNLDDLDNLDVDAKSLFSHRCFE